MEQESTSTRDVSQGPVLKLQLSLFEMGRDRAISSGALKARESDLASLRELAHAMASETKRENYDPDTKKPHRLRENEHQKNMSDTAATQLLFNGCPVGHIKEILGHERLETTCRYYLGLDHRAAKTAHQRFLVYAAAQPIGRIAVVRHNRRCKRHDERVYVIHRRSSLKLLPPSLRA
jgi:hypothetical protein